MGESAYGVVKLDGSGAPLEIHKPKPWHGWREFLKEYVIIVVGVLTALAGEQVAESFHTRHVIAEAEAAMRAELVGDDLPQAYVRVVVAPCLASDLRRLRQAVGDRAPAETFGPLAAAYDPPKRTWDMSAWTSTLSGAASSRMNSDHLLAWSQDYVLVPQLQAAQTQEVHALSRLQLTRFRSGAWSAQRADELNDAIDDLEEANRSMTLLAAGLTTFTEKDGIAIAPPDRANLLKAARKGYGGCAVEPDPAALQRALGQVRTRQDHQELNRALGVDRK